MTDKIVAKDYFIGATAMSLNELEKKLREKVEKLQDKISSTDDIPVRMTTAVKVGEIQKQLAVLVIVIESLEKRDSTILSEYKDNVEMLYLQLKKEYPDYEEDLAYVKNCFMYDHEMEDSMKKGLIWVGFEQADCDNTMAQEACICAIKELFYNKTLMEREGKTAELIEKEDNLKKVINYFISVP
jgi:hypothetical protein